MLEKINLPSTKTKSKELSQEQRKNKFLCYTQGMNSHKHWMFQHPSTLQIGVPATHRGKEKNKFPIPTKYCHQPTREVREN